MQELPSKDFYKLSEVCRVTDTQPYVVRFWESEFPQLRPGKSAGGQRLYRKRDIDVVRRIKQLLDQEEYTLEDARAKLADEMARGKRPKLSPTQTRSRSAPPVRETTKPPARTARKSALPTARRKVADVSRQAEGDVATIPRRRYQDAVDEIDHLRLALKEAEKSRRRAESDAERARARAEKAIDHLERLFEILS